MYELPYSDQRPQRRQVDPCPLSRARARGAAPARRGQGLQADRARARAVDQHRAHAPAQHLRKLGAVDRAQAVLIATERGWI